MQAGTTTFGFLYRRSLVDSLDVIARAGYRTVEIALAPPQIHLRDFDESLVSGLRKALADCGLACVSLNPVEMNLISPHPDLRQVAMNTYRRAIRLAAEIGAEIVVVVPGRQSPLIPMPRDLAVELLLGELGDLLGEARQSGVRLALETVPFGFIESSAEVADVVGRVGDDHLGSALDVANVFGREDIRGSVAAARDLLIAHLSDTWRGRWAHTTLGSGEVDFRAFVDALAGAGFRGPCVYELVDGEDPEPRLAPGLAQLEGWGIAR